MRHYFKVGDFCAFTGKIVVAPRAGFVGWFVVDDATPSMGFWIDCPDWIRKGQA